MAAISKQEYLKRYLSNPDDEKRKKKRKKVNTAAKFTKSVIVDDDVGLNALRPSKEAQNYEEELQAVDEAPVVFDADGVTAISAESYKKREEEKKTKWTPVNTLQGPAVEPRSRVDGDQTRKNVDSSPLRKRRHDSPDLPPPRHGDRAQTPDTSPVRRIRNDSPDTSPVRRIRHDSPDNSPPRRSRPNKNVEKYEKRNQRVKTPDNSPPRQNRHVSPDSSPPRKLRHDSPDNSPPCRRQKRTESPDLSSRTKRHDSPDLSPLRNLRHDSRDILPPRRRQRQSVAQDLSPPRTRRHYSSDESPPRRRRMDSPDMSPLCQKVRQDSDGSPPRRRRPSLGAGKKAGLHSATQLKTENELAKKREEVLFAKMDANVSGRDAETVHRDKHGKKRDLKFEMLKQREKERKKMEEDVKFMEWGKGVTQTKEAKDKREDELYEMSKPLARYRDDKDLDDMLKSQDRAGDPMLAFIQKKQVQRDEKAGVKAKPKYSGRAPPPNRFNVWPGYRWDGVDRSNGFEKKRFEMINNKRATQDQAYKWSTEDM